MKNKPNSIRIACWNARGFKSAIPYLRFLCKKVDVLAISEHWLHENRLGLMEEISEVNLLPRIITGQREDRVE